MNGQNLDNQGLNNNSLDSNTFGSVNLGDMQPVVNPTVSNEAGMQQPNVVPQAVNPEPIPYVANNEPVAPQTIPNSVSTPAPEVVPADNTTTPINPVAQPIPGTENVGTSPMMANANAYINSKPQNIGATPPPVDDNKKQKKPINKLLFVLLLIALICGIAYGVYYFLDVAQKKVVLTPKTVTKSVGEPITTKLSDYATIVKGDTSTCSVQTDANSLEIGDYTYTITCGNKQKYNGKISVVDNTAPNIALNVIFKNVNEQVTVNDFVKSCTDISECTTSFANESDINQNLNNPGGPYIVEIKASDNIGNTKTVYSSLYVSETTIIALGRFESKEEQMSNIQATKVITDYLAMGNKGNGLEYLGMSRRKYTYVLSNQEDYNKIVGTKEATIEFDGVTGIASYDDDNLKLTISTDLNKATLDEEYGGSFPTNYTEFASYYRDIKGYTFSTSKDCN